MLAYLHIVADGEFTQSLELPIVKFMPGKLDPLTALSMSIAPA
jgi:hypothetical protein